jgi:hypothetical protein
MRWGVVTASVQTASAPSLCPVSHSPALKTRWMQAS